MPVRVLVCRGCCCGTVRKHPGVDHDAQLAALSAVAHAREVGCIDECSRSNVVVVRPGDGTSIWFGGILNPTTTIELCDWLAAGAPRPIPVGLSAHVFERNTPAAEPVRIRVAS